MSEYTINGDTLSDIASAIRTKTGKSSTMRPVDMPAEIGSISGGGVKFSKTSLFTSDTDVENITLSDSIENYDAISIIAGLTDSGGHQKYMSTFYPDTLMANAGENVNYGICNDSSQVHFKVIDATHFKRTHRNKMNIEEILGVTYGGGTS